MLKKSAICIGLLMASSMAFADHCVVIGYQNGNQFDGPTFCGNGQEEGIDVNGVLVSSGTEFTGDVSVMGPINATNSIYQNVAVSTTQAYFVSTKVDNMEVLKNQSSSQSIYLSNGTAVASITFDNGNGVVYTDATSTVGKVTGGKVVSSAT